MLVASNGIKVVSYVHTAEGLKDFDELTPAQKVQAATELKLRYLNAMHAGKASFTEKEETV